MRLLCTGGAGFLGSHVVERLSAKCPVVSLDNLDPRCGGNAQRPYIMGDVTDYEGLKKIILEHGITHIAHLAAYGRNLTCRDFPGDAWRINVGGTSNILRLATELRDQIKRVVVCSSNITLSLEATDYKFTKLYVEREVEFFAQAAHISCMALRPSNIFGSGQSITEHQMCAFAGLNSSFTRNNCFLISGNGTQTRDWVHAEDVARAFELALASDVTGVTLDVCTGVQTSMNDIATMLGALVTYTDPRPGDAQALISDPEPAHRQLGFRAQIVLQDRIWDAFPNLPRSVAA